MSPPESTSPESRRPVVLCFGEILWDFLPAGLFPGGAPFNVAYHLHQLGVQAHVVSAVGDDVLGHELLRRLRGWGLGTSSIAILPGHRTGFVRADIGAAGDARYSIVTDVAWDLIPVDDRVLGLAAQADAVVFGSLAQRSTANRASLDRLLAAPPAHALRVFDVNLRPPHDDLALVWPLAARASVLKLNAAEAGRLVRGLDAAAGSEEADARAIAARAGCANVCVTAGADGAGLLSDGTWTWETGRPVEVADTVGAGDAFLASLVSSLLRRKPGGKPDVQATLARACRLGEWVASQRGATPAYGPSTPR